MSEQSELHPAVVALVSLAAGIASKHPDLGLCQLQKLRDQGVPEQQIAAVIEIARHIRDEAARKLDSAFDEQAPKVKKTIAITPAPGGCCSGGACGG